MAIHRYSSRGRTRQPKNVALDYHTGSAAQTNPQAHFKASGSVTIVGTKSNLSDTLASTTAGQNGYDTQNQQYLHLCVHTTGAEGAVVDVYAYNNQFGLWGELKVPLKQDTSSFDSTLVPIAVSGSPNSVYYTSLPINGVDRVAFVCSDTKDVVLYVAGSTF
tara:strand:- start:448 stop:933 length:486 start_codon:yes stop_codon:yes gene_type:complete